MKQSIQTLRGLACIFLVAYHTVGSAPDRGLLMGDGTILRHLADSFVYLRMPLFAFVAGLVYTFRSVTPGQPVAPFILGKARRLLIPMLVVGSLQFIVQTAAMGDMHRLWQGLWIPIFPYEHFWFLQAIFVIFTLVAFLDSFGVLVQRVAVVAALFLAAVIASMDLINTELLSVRGALFLMPFFFLGLYFGRFGDPLARPGGVPIAWALFAIGTVVTQAGLFHYYLDGPLPREAPLGLLFGAAFCMLIIRTGWTNARLEFIGKYSYGIYLFHMFGVAGLRMVLPKIGITQPYLMFVIMLAAGLTLPILVETVASRFNVTRMLLLGQKPLPKAKPAMPPASTDEMGATGPVTDTNFVTR